MKICKLTIIGLVGKLEVRLVLECGTTREVQTKLQSGPPIGIRKPVTGVKTVAQW